MFERLSALPIRFEVFQNVIDRTDNVLRGGSLLAHVRRKSLPHNRVIHTPADVVHQELAVGFGHGEVQDGDNVFDCGWVDFAFGADLVDDSGDCLFVLVGRPKKVGHLP